MQWYRMLQRRLLWTLIQKRILNLKFQTGGYSWELKSLPLARSLVRFRFRSYFPLHFPDRFLLTH